MIIEAKDLSKQYNGRILFEHLSFSVEKGIVLIQGKSGCGKSTLLKILSHQIEPDTGSVLYDENISYSYCGSTIVLSPYLSLNENILFLDKQVSDNTKEKLKETLSFSFDDKKLYTLSQGERKKAELIFSLSQEKDIDFLDEPFAPLDRQSKEALLDFLLEQSKEKIIVLISHDTFRKEIPYSIKIEFDQGQLLLDSRIDEKKINHPTNSRIDFQKKIKIGWQYLFKRNFIYGLFKTLLSLLTLIFFSLGCSYVNSKSPNENKSISITQNPYQIFETYAEGKTPFSIDFLQREGIQKLTLHADYGNHEYRDLLLIGTQKEEDSFLHYNPNEKSVYPVIKEIKNQEAVIHKVEEITSEEFPMKNYLDNSLMWEEILFVSNSFINEILLYNTNFLPTNSFSFLSLPDIEMNGDSLSLKSPYLVSKRNIDIEKKDEYVIQADIQSEKINLLRSNEIIEENIPVLKSDTDNVSLSLSAYKDLLLHSSRIENEYSIYFTKEDLLSILKTDNPTIVLIIPYQENRTNILLYFSLSGFSFLFYLFFVLFTSNVPKARLKEIKSIYESNQYSGYRTSYLLLNLLETGSGFLLSLLLYPLCFLSLGNLINASSFFPKGYGMMNEAYKGLSAIPFLTFENIFFFILPIFLLLCLIGILIPFLRLRKE